jgi:hypothetical protein
MAAAGISIINAADALAQQVNSRTWRRELTERRVYLLKRLIDTLEQVERLILDGCAPCCHPKGLKIRSARIDGVCTLLTEAKYSSFSFSDQASYA